MDDISRFRLSIQLEATQRALKGQWGRQVAVWACTFFEILAFSVVPGIHLVTSAYITIAILVLLYFLSSCRAGSLLDPFLWPVHLIRPKDQSRFGLGENQQAAGGFCVASLLLRCVSSVVMAVLLSELLFATQDLAEQCGFEMWTPIDPKSYQDDVSSCRNSGNASCESLLSFDQRCHNRSRWTNWLRSQALEEVGLPCDDHVIYDNQTLQLMKMALESDWFENEYCETLNGTEIACYSWEDPFAFVYTSKHLKNDEVCASWPLHFNYTYWCYTYMSEATHCDELTLPRETQSQCGSKGCRESLPYWITDILDITFQVWYCRCLSCAPWWRSNICTLEMVNKVYRIRAGVDEINYGSLISLDLYMKDPTYSVQLIVSMVMILSPAVSLLALGFFAVCKGNPVAMPRNQELQQQIQAEELVIADELRSTGTVIQRTPFAVCAGTKIEQHLNRLLMLLELALYLVDFALDLEMISLYLQKHHYWFGICQSCIVVRSLLELLLRHVLFGPNIFREVIDSFKANLRTDVFLTILQNEKTGEAALSFVLQTYALFYMGSELFAYWTALFSLLISARGIAQGCYIHFDLAVVPGKLALPRACSATSVVPMDVEEKHVEGRAESEASWSPDMVEGPPQPAWSPDSPEFPAEGPPMMDLQDEPEEHEKDGAGTMCADGTGENLQQPEMNDTAVSGKGVSIIVPL